MDLDLMHKLSVFKEEFEPLLNDRLDAKIRQASFVNKAAANLLYETKKVIANNGKRFRPALAYYTFVANDGPENLEGDIFKLGIALEIFHSYGLIHDDILDQSLLRRGDPTLEASYREIFGRYIKGESRVNQLALNAAISGGDFAHLIADEVFSEIDIEDKNIKQKINSLYFEMQFEVHAGQADDSFGVGISELEDATEKQVFRMIDYKSGRYSIQKPMLLGAALAGMSEENLAKLDKIGQDLGLVFQIKDDILGLYGSEEEIGKSNTSDITEGKRTVLMIRTFEVASDEDKEKIKGILGNPDAKPEEIEWLKEAVKGYGVLEEIETFCTKMVKESKAGLEELFDVKNNPGATFLYELADFIWYRKK